MQAPVEALRAFNIPGAIDKIALFGSGHINDTYEVEVESRTYLLQRVNQSVFEHPERIEHNLKKLLSKEGGLFVRHYRTAGGGLHHQNTSGTWRLTDFIPHAYAPETADSLAEVREVARGFGQFIAHTHKLSADDFEEPIARFHDLDWRLAQFHQSVKTADKTRMNTALELIEKVNQAHWITKHFKELLDKGLPRRVCHNDTKLNNCLLSQKDCQFEYLIDLDTVGPGYVIFDFGDLIRTTISPALENEVDESLITVRMDYYQHLEEGFMESCKEVLLPIEIESLKFGGLYMTYIMAIRFLTDYLNGDIYYKTSFKDENQIRARNQLRLLEKLRENLF